MAPKLRDLSLTATERTAITALLQVKAAVQQRSAEVEEELAQVAADIEKRLRLSPGSLGTTYDINAETWALQQIDRNGKE